MDSYRYEVEARSAAPPEEVFTRLYDAEHWKDWAGPMIGRSTWVQKGDPPPGGVGAIRSLGRYPVMAKEEIVASEAPRHHAYILRSGLPTRSYRADVNLSELDGGTHISWSGTFVPSIPGTGPALRWVLTRTMGAMARRLAAGPGGGSARS